MVIDAKIILSFHPLFAAEKNIICAGRAPGPDDAQAAAEADAIILPQGCRRELYELARKSCPLVFPNYDARFAFQGKMGQIAASWVISPVFGAIVAASLLYFIKTNVLRVDDRITAAKKWVPILIALMAAAFAAYMAMKGLKKTLLFSVIKSME